jgi:hypothetical protein
VVQTSQRSHTTEDLGGGDGDHDRFIVLLTEPMETCDPETGSMRWMPLYYTAWADGKGNSILTDHDGAPERANEPE